MPWLVDFLPTALCWFLVQRLTGLAAVVQTAWLEMLATEGFRTLVESGRDAVADIARFDLNASAIPGFLVERPVQTGRDSVAYTGWLHLTAFANKNEGILVL